MNNQNNNIIIGAIIAVIALSGIAFYAGMQYEAHGITASAAPNFSQQSGRFGGGAGTPGGAPRTAQRFGGATIGSVLSKDQNSMTIKLQNGGSQIVFYTASTSVVKSSPSSIDDVRVNDSVLITGKPNSDGSVSASSIQDGIDMTRFRTEAPQTQGAPAGN